MTHASASNALFGVTQSATGRIWRDRLDARGDALSLAIAQRHQRIHLVVIQKRGRATAPVQLRYHSPGIQRRMQVDLPLQLAHDLIGQPLPVAQPQQLLLLGVHHAHP